MKTIWVSVALMLSACAGGEGSSADINSEQDTSAQVGDAQSSEADSSGGVDSGSGADSSGGGSHQWYTSCGAPVCSTWRAKPNVPLCTTEKAGQACAPGTPPCDPKSDCNESLICADKDPKQQPGGCPISSRAVKREINYLSPAAEARYGAIVEGLRLATWTYRQGDSRRRLGIILEDTPIPEVIDSRGDRVDLYGYTSLALAALKAQAQQLRQQRSELAELRQQVQLLLEQNRRCRR